MAASPDRLVQRLLDAGLANELVEASLPDWWTPQEQSSSSARTMVALLLARRLSLDPETLLDDNVPIGFLHAGPTKFKHMRLGAGERLDALVGFARGVGRIVLSALAPETRRPVPADPMELRRAILSSGRPFVSFGDAIAVCWSLGIPVLHLRLFPARTKGVTAMAVRLGQRYAILVARETGFEAQYMFHVVHEIGHIALGHLEGTSAIVEADPTDPANAAEELVDDDEERAADAYAQALLTGSSNFEVVRDTLRNPAPYSGTGRELADLAVTNAAQLGVDPGHIVMCFGHSTGDWGLAMAAAKLLPSQRDKPGTLVNRVLWQQIDSDIVDRQAVDFLQAVAPI